MTKETCLELGKYRVGSPSKPSSKPITDRILETLNKKGPLSLDSLIENFPQYNYCMKDLLAIKVESKDVREIKENSSVLYEITEHGRQSVKYGFGKKFFKLNK